MGADRAFCALERRQAIGIVPAIVVAELYYVTVKLGQQISVDALLRRIDASPALRLGGFTRQHLMAFGRLGDLPEMHDRLIGAAAVVHDAPIVTRDQLLRDHPFIRVVW